MQQTEHANDGSGLRPLGRLRRIFWIFPNHSHCASFSLLVSNNLVVIPVFVGITLGFKLLLADAPLQLPLQITHYLTLAEVTKMGTI